MTTPRNVRNFWIEIDVERQGWIKAGPRAKDEGFTMMIFQRDKGKVVNQLTIEGIVDGNKLCLQVLDSQESKLHYQKVTQR